MRIGRTTRFVLAVGSAAALGAAAFTTPAAAFPGDRVETELVSGPTAVERPAPGTTPVVVTPGALPAPKNSHAWSTTNSVTVTNAVSKEALFNWAANGGGNLGGSLTAGATAGGAKSEGTVNGGATGGLTLGGGEKRTVTRTDAATVTVTHSGTIEYAAATLPHTGYRIDYRMVHQQYQFRQRTCGFFGCSKWRTGAVLVPDLLLIRTTYLGWTQRQFFAGGASPVCAPTNGVGITLNTVDNTYVIECDGYTYGRTIAQGRYTGKVQEDALFDISTLTATFATGNARGTVVVKRDPYPGNGNTYRTFTMTGTVTIKGNPTPINVNWKG